MELELRLPEIAKIFTTLEIIRLTILVFNNCRETLKMLRDKTYAASLLRMLKAKALAGKTKAEAE
ncbi:MULTISPECIES: hypothetical protein [Nostoc]|uniref:Transposase n=1 Tax=Nostoc paludosum FACHB-159 TaxID=2692908 RepID=A0ABR8K961_9NOSO|nr:MULTISPECIES: hypothetical protein [Nostoc]MBD2679785.1 hypothetical protein [Nostoc sp. FACHB-857]MBD2736033.1 hypothetical protein [Nostoc paludosum FACHB-159]